MKKHLTIGLILLSICFSLLYFNGCGALLALVSAVFGDLGAFAFVPFLEEGKITESQAGKLPGMIMLYTNNPPPGYKPLPGATAKIAGVSMTTDGNGYFHITGLPVGLQNLSIEHPSYVSIEQQIPISDPNTSSVTFNNFNVTPSNLLIPIGIGGIFQFSSYATSSNGTLVKPLTSWSVIGDIGTIGEETGIFTATKAGTGFIRATSGSSSSQTPVTVVNGTGTVYGYLTYNSQPVKDATVYINGFTQYTITSIEGSYIIPGIPATTVEVIGKYQISDPNYSPPTCPSCSERTDMEASNVLYGTTIVTVPSGGQVEANIVLVNKIDAPTPGQATPFPTAGTPTLTPVFTATPSVTPTPTIPLSPPVIISIEPPTQPPGSTVIIVGNNFGASQGSSFVTFSSITAEVISWSPTQIEVVMPGIYNGPIPVSVTVGGVESNIVQYFGAPHP